MLIFLVSEETHRNVIFGREKRAQRLSFWVRRPPGGVGVFHAKGWWPKTSCPPSKLCLPWVSKRGIRDVPGILPGCPGPLAVFKKFVQKNFVRIFRSLNFVQLTGRLSQGQPDPDQSKRFVFMCALKALTSLNKEVRPFFLSDNSIWSLPSVSSLSDYSIWSSWRRFYPWIIAPNTIVA